MGRLLAALVCAIVLGAPASAMELPTPAGDRTTREIAKPAASPAPAVVRCADDPVGRAQVSSAVARQRAALAALRVQHTRASVVAIISNAEAMLDEIAAAADRGLRELGTCGAIAQRATAATETVIELARSSIAQEVAKRTPRPTPTPRARRR